MLSLKCLRRWRSLMSWRFSSDKVVSWEKSRTRGNNDSVSFMVASFGHHQIFVEDGQEFARLMFLHCISTVSPLYLHCICPKYNTFHTIVSKSLWVTSLRRQQKDNSRRAFHVWSSSWRQFSSIQNFSNTWVRVLFSLSGVMFTWYALILKVTLHYCQAKSIIRILKSFLMIETCWN